jgi:hypothetical protein
VPCRLAAARTPPGPQHAPARARLLQQALLTLVQLRKIGTFSQPGAGFGISRATAWQYVDEALDVLASWTPGLHEALTGLGEGGHVIVDGTLIPTDRIRADEPYCSTKHRKHGMNVQVVTRPGGTPLWFSRATPGRTHDLAAARAHGTSRPARPGGSSSPASRPMRSPRSGCITVCRAHSF